MRPFLSRGELNQVDPNRNIFCCFSYRNSNSSQEGSGKYRQDIEGQSWSDQKLNSTCHEQPGLQRLLPKYHQRKTRWTWWERAPSKKWTTQATRTKGKPGTPRNSGTSRTYGASRSWGQPGESISVSSIMAPPMSVVANETGTALFQCEVEEYQKPKVTWLKNNHVVFLRISEWCQQVEAWWSVTYVKDDGTYNYVARKIFLGWWHPWLGWLFKLRNITFSCYKLGSLTVITKVNPVISYNYFGLFRYKWIKNMKHVFTRDWNMEETLFLS